MNKDDIKNKLNKLSIMYIEDEESIRENIVNILNMLFKDIYSFSNAEDALIQYDKIKPDIVLSDIGLDKMNGIDFIRNIRERGFNTPALLLSAYSDKNMLFEAMSLKLIDYLTKPITFTELLNAFKKCIKDIDESNKNELYEISDHVIYDINKQELHNKNEEVHLTHKEHLLLSTLLKNKHKILNIEELKNSIWEDAYNTSDGAFKTLLTKLRTKVGQDVIINVSGSGYYIKLM